MPGAAIWEARFRAPKLTLPHWSRSAPDRTVYTSNESGIWQIHAWDAGTGARRQVSDHPVGVLDGFASDDGEHVVFWQEDTGDETGRWMRQPFEGGASEPLLVDVPVGWHEGIALARGVVATVISSLDGFGIFVARDGEPAKEIVRSPEWLAIGGAIQGRPDRGGLSADGALLAVEHAEHGDLIHPAVRVYDVRTGAVIGERRDEGLALGVTSWSPIAGDGRVAVLHERADRERAALWEPATDRWIELETDLRGDVHVADWFPDGKAVLLWHGFEGRDELYRHELATGSSALIATPRGSIEDALVRPDGSVWFQGSDGARRRRVLDERGQEPISVDEPAPAGRPFADWLFPNERGERVHGWIVEPEGEGPHPVMLYVHGGPHWHYADDYMPEVQAFVDAGFLVAMPNYRGSTGYGRGWRDALTGDPGFTDVDDVTAGLRDLLRREDVDAARAVVAGWSWGGYVTLMQLGRNPDLWRAGVAGVPVGDLVRAYEEEAPALQAMDRALFGGTPEEAPELFARGNPITYVDRVRAPVMFLIGENDSRCPPGQALAYVDRLRARDHPLENYLYSTGHGSNEVEENVRQHRAILDFLKAQVPGLRDV